MRRIYAAWPAAVRGRSRPSRSELLLVLSCHPPSAREQLGDAEARPRIPQRDHSVGAVWRRHTRRPIRGRCRREGPRQTRGRRIHARLANAGPLVSPPSPMPSPAVLLSLSICACVRQSSLNGIQGLTSSLRWRHPLHPSLLDSVLEGLTEREGRNYRGLDRHFLPRLRIAPLPLGAFF